MQTHISHFIGIDISKEHLAVTVSDHSQSQQFNNSPEGIAALLQWLKPFATVQVIFEATGIYHRLLLCTLSAENIAYSMINPKRARRFAEACGMLAKTDKVDAMMLAHLGETLRPTPHVKASNHVETLREFVSARRALIKERTALISRMKGCETPLLMTLYRKQKALIEESIKTIDQACETLVKTDETLTRKRDILISVPGFSDITATLLLSDMPELGRMNKKQAASLAGLAPFTRQSGQWRGQSFIQGGRAALRRSLYMPALVAIRKNPFLKRIYEQMRESGKAFKVAITAIMRRLIIIANALLRDNRKWT